MPFRNARSQPSGVRVVLPVYSRQRLPANPAATVQAGHEVVLRLQRGAGNRAVAGFLGRGAAASVVRRSSGAPSVVVQRAPSTPRTWTKIEQGDLGELIIEQLLEQRGFSVFRDWDKRGNRGGVDTVAYDPKEKILYLIDNKAQKKTINNASALSIERLGVENLDGVRQVLDSNTGFSEDARQALKAGRVRFVLSNAHPGNVNASFSTAVFQRGWYALDIATGGIYSSLRDFQAARAAAFPTGTAGRRSGVRGQRGFASVGGMLFSIVSIGGVIFALSELNSVEDLTTFMATNIVVTGSSIAAARLAGSVGVGFVVGMLLTMENDHGPGARERMAKSSLVESFLRQHFPQQQIAKNGAALRAQTHALLFDTEPAIIVPPRREHSAAGRMAATAISELDGRKNYKVLIHVFLLAGKGRYLKEFADIMRTRLHGSFGNYFNYYLDEIHNKWSDTKVEKWVLTSFVGAGVPAAKRP